MGASVFNRQRSSRARGRIYQFLSLGFTYPEPEALDGMRLHLKNPNFRRAAASLCGRGTSRNLAHLGDHLGIDPQELRAEYIRLFVTGFDVPCPPYESARLSGNRRVMGDSVDRVLAMYCAEGLGPAGELRDLPDHIRVELEFMHYLCCKEAEAPSGCPPHPGEPRRTLDAQRRFLSQHLLNWAPAWCLAVIANTRSPVYRALAEITLDFLVSEAKRNKTPVRLPEAGTVMN